MKTNPGMVMGTVQYMSPEQARGKEVDARTDIWSLGVVLYEMVTGRAPFEGETPSHVIVSILENEPSPLAHFMAVPAELERIVNKALRKNKEERYQTASDLALDLKSLRQELEVDARLKRSLEPDASGRETTAEIDGQMALDTVHASAVHTADFEIRHPTSSAEYLVNEIKRHKGSAVFASATLILVIVTVAYFSYFTMGGGEAIDSVAVLPFVNVGADPNNEYLSEGISDSIINKLSQLPNLKVISLSSVLHYKGQQTNPQIVGRELNVQAVLIGRLTKREDSLAISTELVNVRDNRRLWGQQYDSKLADIQVVQAQISEDISKKLRLKLTGQEKQRLTKRYTENSQAYNLYILGNYYERQGTKEGWEKSIEHFKEAIKLDPNFALAYSGLCAAYSNLGMRGFLPSKEARQKAEWTALKAIEIDDTLSEAHASLGYIKKRNWDWAGAEKEFKRALELNPNLADTYMLYTALLLDSGRADEAIALARRGQEVDPLAPVAGVLGFAYLGARQYDRAIELFLKSIEQNPNGAHPHFFLGETYLAKGMYSEGVRELQKAVAIENAPERWDRHPTLAYAYAVAGKRDEALKLLDQQKELAKQRYVSPFNFAIIYTGLGNKDRAFEWLEKAYEEHSQALDHIKVRPMFDSLREDPRYADLLRRMNLAP